ncbi:MAG: glycosyltransferase family protein [Acidobacteriota bacterium]|nr:glycosyltransferase family protein [Acidobacteriota bacterium]
MNDSRVAVVVQARMSSRRLPGKVLAPLAGAPALVRMMERVARVRGVERPVVATSTDPSDDRIVDVCARHEIACVRGPLDDVLGRFLLAAPAGCGIVVRLTGDCPLIDPGLVERHIEVFRREQPWIEYVSNAVVRTMPDGLDVEVVSRRILEEADRQAVSDHDREHVTPWVRRRARSLAVTQEIDLAELRWTLDTPSDLAVIAEVYAELYETEPRFDSVDIYRLLVRRPELIHVAGATTPPDAARAEWRRRIEAHLFTVDEAVR